MITLTASAREKMAEFLATEEPGQAIRIAIAGRMKGAFEYDIAMVAEDERADDDTVIDAGAFKVYIDARSAPNLQGATVDYLESGNEAGFKLDNPNPLWSDPVALAVQKVLDEEVNPGVASHGGVVTLLDVQADTVYVALGGGCQGCGMASVTLKQGIEASIKKSVPSIAKVLDTTDHATGSNPYYQPSKGGASPFDA